MIPCNLPTNVQGPTLLHHLCMVLNPFFIQGPTASPPYKALVPLSTASPWIYPDFFLKKICWTKAQFVEPPIAPVLDFGCPSSRVSNPEWSSRLHSCKLVVQSWDSSLPTLWQTLTPGGTIHHCVSKCACVTGRHSCFSLICVVEMSDSSYKMYDHLWQGKRHFAPLSTLHTFTSIGNLSFHLFIKV